MGKWRVARIEERRSYVPEDVAARLIYSWAPQMSEPSGRSYYRAVLVDEEGREVMAWGWTPEEALRNAEARAASLTRGEA
ncbi:hypothetical protein [Thermoflexus hugenholtzii]